MTEVTVTDYKTVEETKTKYQCDHCDAIVGEDNINTVGKIEGLPRSTARFDDRSVEMEHLCEECSGYRRALEIKEEKDYLRSRWKGITDRSITAVNYTTPVFAYFFGLASMLIAGMGGYYNGADWGYYIIDPILGGIVTAIAILISTVLLIKILGKPTDST